jgi:hypothetical protein
MEQKGFRRKLTAILSADVAGSGISLQLHTLAYRPWWASAHGTAEQQRSVNLESRLLNPYRFGLSI